MLQKIYYQLSSLRYRFSLRKIGKGCQLRFGSRFLGGKYMSFGDHFVLGMGAVFAVYPNYAGEKTPVAKGEGNGITVGNNVSANRNLTIYCANSVEIGDDVMMGSGILITDNDHGIDPTQRDFRAQPLIARTVKIGNGCWIGEKASILSGVEVGEHSIIAAGAVVTKSIPPYSIAAGVPAKVIKRWNFEKGAWETV